MKLEYLSRGSEDCPLVRLYHFRPAEAEELKRAFNSLASGKAQEVSLEQLSFVESIGEVVIRLKCGKRDLGGRLVQPPSTFEWELTREQWDNVVGLIEPFCEQAEIGYQWLDKTGPISLLLSTNANW